jgi:hypothetical protein
MTARVVKWWVPLTLVTTLLVRASSGAPDEASALWWWAEVALNRLGLLLPFVMFAGGLEAARRGSSLKRTLLRAIPLVLIGYALGAFAAPGARLRQAESEGRDIEAYYPTGALTPPNLLRLREEVVARSPDAFSFSVDEPLRRPPNWLTYEAHQSAAVAVLGLLNLLLGVSVGRLTARLSPPVRRRRRWVVGLVGAVLFFAPIVVASVWVRTSAENSGVVGAWLPLLVPLLALSAASRRERSRADLHSGSAANV